MRDLIAQRLRGTTPAADPVAAALAALPNGVADIWFERPLIPAAVLVTLVAHDDGPGVLLTKRTAHLRDHPGQISFPGGRAEEHDAGPEATALRELHEEIGIAPDAVDVVGYLEPMAVITGFAVTPVVGFVAPGYTLQLDSFEVQEAFEVPLTLLLEEGSRVATIREFRGIESPFWEFHHDGRRIWGATAMMLNQLVELINKNN